MVQCVVWLVKIWCGVVLVARGGVICVGVEDLYRGSYVGVGWGWGVWI